MKGYFIASLRQIRISERIRSYDIGWDVKLFSRFSDVENVVTAQFLATIGPIETQYLRESSCIILKEFTEENENTIFGQEVELLDQFHTYATYFCQMLWLVKDNSAAIEMGFLEYPTIIEKSRITSNTVYGNFYNSDGKSNIVDFSQSELSAASNFRRVFVYDDCQSLIFLNYSDRDSGEIDRIGRSLTYLRRGRNSKDLVVRISEFCILLECLFSTDTQEVSHKTAERAAYFWSEEVEKRVEIFKVIKKAYAIRSRFLHGDSISQKSIVGIQEISRTLNHLFRRIYRKILEKEDIFKLFYKDEKNSFDEFWLKKVLEGNPF